MRGPAWPGGESVESRGEVGKAIAFLRGWLKVCPSRWGIVLGSGLDGVATDLEAMQVVRMAEVPGFPRPGIMGHEGIIRSGRLGKNHVLIFAGRPHLYEGRPIDEVTCPIAIMATLGVRALLLTNAAGSLDGGVKPGTLFRACDAIQFPFRFPPGDATSLPSESLQPFFDADPPTLFDTGIGRRIDEAATEIGIDLRRGVLAWMVGPAYETAAEVRLLRRAGADAVCMSTIPEAREARRLGIRVAAVSILANAATGIGETTRIGHEDVVFRAAAASADLDRLLRMTITGQGGGE